MIRLNLLTWSLRSECTNTLFVARRSLTVVNQKVQNYRFQHDLSSSTQEQRLDEEQRTIGLTNKEQKKLANKKPPRDQANSEVLKVAIIGAPNAGKSTLANRLIGWKFAAVSEKVHTTRQKTIGMLTENNKQVIFLDTPGIITQKKLKRHNLERSLLTDPHSSVREADLIAVVVDISHVWHRSRIDQELIKVLHMNPDRRSVLVLNKVDLLKDKQELLSIVRTLTEGMVGGTKSWSTAKAQKQAPNLKAMFHRMKGENSSDLNPLSSVNGDGALSGSDSDGDVTTQSDSIPVMLMNNNSLDPVDRILDSDDCVQTPLHDPLVQTSTIYTSNQSNTDSRGQVSNVVRKPLNLADTDAWNAYNKRLQAVGRVISNQNGWAHFDKVFMISALSGDGVLDLKDYLLSATYPSRWLHHPCLVTDQNPIELARLCVWERLLDNLPDEIPYSIDLRLSCWEVSEDGLLRASFDVICHKKRHLRYVLGLKGSTIRRISAEAKQELMNAFRREISLRLVVKGTPGVADPEKMQRHE